MKTIFERYAWRLNPAEIITARECPLPGFVMPAHVHQFYEDFKTQQAAMGRFVGGGFLHGGAIPDIVNRKRPKDLDVYVCAPEFVAALKKSYVKPTEDDPLSLFGRTERIEIAMGRGFPLELAEDKPVPKNNELFGDFVEMEGYYHKDGEVRLFDLRVGTQALTMERMLSWFHAPVMAVATSLEGEGKWVYHKDMPDHLERGIMRIAGDVPDVLKRKAARKGMTIEQLPPPPPP